MFHHSQQTFIRHYSTDIMNADLLCYKGFWLACGEQPDSYPSVSPFDTNFTAENLDTTIIDCYGTGMVLHHAY